MAQYDVDIREYWRILKKRKLTVLLVAVLLGMFSTLFAVLRAPTPLYSSTCSIKFEKDSPEEGVYGRAGSWGGGGNDLETVISLLKSYKVMEKVAERLGRLPRREDGAPSVARAAQVVQGLESKVQISREPFASIIHIQVTDTSPAFAQELANTLARTYKDIHAQEQGRRSTETMAYIEDQLEKVRDRLRNAEGEMNRFTRQHQIVSIDLQSEALLSRRKEIQSELRTLREAETELTALLSNLEGFTEDPSNEDANFYSTHASERFKNANQALVGLLAERDSLLEDYTPRHPQVIAVRRNIVEQARKMSFLLASEIEAVQKKQAELNKELQEINRKTNDLMEKKLEYDRLQRKVTSLNDMIAMLERKHQETQIRKADQPEEISIVRPAVFPKTPTNPPKTAATGVIGIITGLILGMVLAFVAETFDTSIGAIEDVEETLGSQVLGVIPQGDVKALREGLSDKERPSSFGYELDLVSHLVPQSMMAESFRGLRTNVQFKDLEKKFKTFVITSASPQEGKTMVSCNLAVTMAQMGLKTLLVGSDFRKPTIARVFGIESAPGLADVLLGNYEWRDVTRTITDIIVGRLDLDDVMRTPGLDNLNIITSGTIPPNPGELIESKRMATFIEEVQQEYDAVLFDTPPILSTADPLVLATKLDTVLLVYRVGSVGRGLLKRASLQLAQVKANFLGVVLNGMRAEVSPDFHDFKYYKSYYAYGEKDNLPKPGKGGILGKWRRSKKKVKRSFQPVAKGRAKIARPILLLIAAGLLALGLLLQERLLPPVQKPMQGRPDESKMPAPLVKQEVRNKPETSSPPQSMPDEERNPAEEAAIPPGEAPSTEEEPTTPSAPTPTVSTPAAATVAEGKAHRPYSIQVSAFQTLEEAREAASHLMEQGLSPYWCQVDLGDQGTWYRVFVGQFEGIQQAEAFQEQFGLEQARVMRTRFAVQVLAKGSDSTLSDIASSLRDSGYAPYFQSQENATYRLLVGAFITREGARDAAQRLRETGAEVQIVLR